MITHAKVDRTLEFSWFQFSPHFIPINLIYFDVKKHATAAQALEALGLLKFRKPLVWLPEPVDWVKGSCAAGGGGGGVRSVGGMGGQRIRNDMAA